MGRTTKAIHRLEEYQPSKVDTLIITNSSSEYIEQIDFHRAFHVIRDPRDIVVSSYYSHLISHKTDVWKDLLSHREQLKRLSKEEGLIYEIEECRKQQFLDMANWEYNRSEILEIKYEDFINDLDAHWRAILTHLEIDIKKTKTPLLTRLTSHHNKFIKKLNNKFPSLGYNLYLSSSMHSDQLNQIIEAKDYVRRSGRSPGNEDINHHYRKGISGDWKNHFSEPIKDCFKRNWGELLIQLGYENDMNW